MSQICIDLPLNHSFWGVLNIFQKGFTAFLTLVSKSLMGDNPVMTGETNPCIQTIATEVPIYIYMVILDWYLHLCAMKELGYTPYKLP